MESKLNFNSIEICSQVADVSTKFEIITSELKRKYLLLNIMLYNRIVTGLSDYRGSFGTGYPFNVLDENLQGQLPVIQEQIRYNRELIYDQLKAHYTNWSCASCLETIGSMMPDLKTLCKPCPNMDNSLKPRKLLNRLPDIDLWMVTDQEKISKVSEELTLLFKQHGLQPSDISPLQSMQDIVEITDDLQNGVMPSKTLPLDSHIVSYSTLYNLIEQVPSVLKRAKENQIIPYLPIHPLSYRKTWQYDDTAYNFIYDYLAAFTPYNFDSKLDSLLKDTRKNVVSSFSFEELYAFLLKSGTEANMRRSLELKKNFEERINSWKR